MSDSICSFVPCGRPVRTRQWCNGHYLQVWKGKPLSPLRSDLTLRQKIETNLLKPDGESGCWVWSKHLSDGYGMVKWKGKELRVHRAYLIELGVRVPTAMDVDHLCRNKACSNPAHLEVVTHRENVLRHIRATRND